MDKHINPDENNAQNVTPSTSGSFETWSSGLDLAIRQDAADKLLGCMFTLQQNLETIARYNEDVPELYEANSRMSEVFKIAQELRRPSSEGSESDISLLNSFELETLNTLYDLFENFQPHSGFEGIVSACEFAASVMLKTLQHMPRRLMAMDDSTTYSKVIDILINRAGIYVQQLSLREALKRTQKAAVAAEKSARHVQEVAGEAGQQGLASHFRSYADQQKSAADWLRYGVILIVIVISSAIIWLLGVRDSNDITWIELVRKLALGIPAAALAAYLGRESARHRDQADWAEAIEVQLRTLGAFTDPLDDETKKEIRGELGRKVFGASFTSRKVRGPVDSSVLDNPTPADLIAKIVRAIADDGNSGVR